MLVTPRLLHLPGVQLWPIVNWFVHFIQYFRLLACLHLDFLSTLSDIFCFVFWLAIMITIVFNAFKMYLIPAIVQELKSFARKDLYCYCHCEWFTFICFISSNICSGGKLATACVMASGASSGATGGP